MNTSGARVSTKRVAEDHQHEKRRSVWRKIMAACPALASQLHGYTSRKFLPITEMS